MIKKRVVQVKIESTYNTDAVPATNTDDVRILEFEVANANLRMLPQPTVKNTMGALPPVYAGTLKEMTIKVALRGSGTIDVAPDWGPLAQCCRLLETEAAATSVTYAPTSGAQKSITVYEYYDGKLRKYTGCVGDMEFVQTTGEFHILNFKILGHFVSETDVSLPDPTYDTNTPLVAIGGSFTVSSYAASIQTLQFSLGNTIAVDPDYNSSDGYGTLEVTDREVTGSIDPKDVLIATEDFYAKFIAGTPVAIVTAALGSTEGNKVAISLPTVVYTDESGGDRDLVLTRNLNFFCYENAGDDQMLITLT